VFQEDWNDIQLSFLGANGLTEIRNAGVARIRGIESDFTYRADGLTLTLSGSYNDATIQRDFCRIANPTFDCTLNPGDGRTNALLAPAGTQLPVTAKFKGNAIARYEFPVGGWDGHVQGAASYIGRRRSDLRTAENAIKGDFDPYTTVDLSIGMRKDNLRFDLFVTNLFDERGVINSGVQCVETVCGDPTGISNTGGPDIWIVVQAVPR
jgi:outer membrane receptor protein involved in Fe transport